MCLFVYSNFYYYFSTFFSFVVGILPLFCVHYCNVIFNTPSSSIVMFPIRLENSVESVLNSPPQKKFGDSICFYLWLLITNASDLINSLSESDFPFDFFFVVSARSPITMRSKLQMAHNSIVVQLWSVWTVKKFGEILNFLIIFNVPNAMPIETTTGLNWTIIQLWYA